MRLTLAQQHIAFSVVHLDDFDFDLIVQFDILIDQVRALDESVRFIPDADADFIIRDLHDFSGQRLSGPDPHQSRFDFSHEVIVVVLLNGRGQVLVLQFAHACDNLLK